MNENHKFCREEIIKRCKRIVVKVGTRLLTASDSIPKLISQINQLRIKGYSVILVSSGAVGLGMKIMKLSKRPSSLAEKQALAAIGQSRLMSLYERECSKYGFHAAQLLLTAEDLSSRERHINVLNCIDSLWNSNVLPIVNENDSVSVSALKFGDNDILAGLLGTMTRAELTIILTSVDGLYSYKNNPDGDRISVVERVNDKIKSLATGTDDSSMSVGGMISKIRAAEMLTTSGETLWVANGTDPEILLKIINAEDVGTVFLPRSKQLESKKRWIRIFAKKSGRLTVDDGAVRALVKHGRSLLPSGIVKVDGNFKRGDTVEISDRNGNVIAAGLINYNTAEAGKLAGCQSQDIAGIINKDAADEEIIHRNNLVILKTLE